MKFLKVKDLIKLLPLLKVSGTFREGVFIQRPNRFTLEVDLNGIVERVHLANPGGLSTILEKGREVLLLESESKRRKTSFDAFAVKVGKFYVTVESTLANRIFEAAVQKGLLEEFSGSYIAFSERQLADFGRIDFILKKNGGDLYVEVKSCTHANAGVAMFPDRQTERGRRHLRKLIDLSSSKESCYVVFVIQRPDVEKFCPFWDVDPLFAQLLVDASKVGVKIKAFSTEFKPSERTIYLVNPSLPVFL